LDELKVSTMEIPMAALLVILLDGMKVVLLEMKLDFAMV
jgi:hypothetical protein